MYSIVDFAKYTKGVKFEGDILKIDNKVFSIDYKFTKSDNNLEPIGGKYVDLYLDGIKLETDCKIGYVSPTEFRIWVLNTSVLQEAGKMDVTFKYHSTEPMREYGFDHSKLQGRTIAEQQDLFELYLRNNLSLDHVIYTEGIAYTFIRDADDVYQRPSDKTKSLKFLTLPNFVGKGNHKYNTSLSNHISHGHIRESIYNPILKEIKPSVYDVLFNNLRERVPKKVKLFESLNKHIETIFESDEAQE